MSSISLEQITYTYPGSRTGSRPAISDLSLNVEQDEFACVLGPSGCGKTTALQVLAGLAVPESGTVRVGSEVLCSDGVRYPAANTRFGYLFQDGRLLPWRTVAKNIELAMSAAGLWTRGSQETIEELLDAVGMREFKDTWPLRLSGGQRQRVALVRALAVDPQVLLMDEPFGTLDEVTARVLRDRMLALWQESKRTVLFVTHSIREAVYLADVIHVLSDGPGRLLKSVRVPLDRPREYNSAELAAVEADLTHFVLDQWRQFHE